MTLHSLNPAYLGQQHSSSTYHAQPHRLHSPSKNLEFEAAKHFNRMEQPRNQVLTWSSTIIGAIVISTTDDIARTRTAPRGHQRHENGREENERGEENERKMHGRVSGGRHLSSRVNGSLPVAGHCEACRTVHFEPDRREGSRCSAAPSRFHHTRMARQRITAPAERAQRSLDSAGRS